MKHMSCPIPNASLSQWDSNDFISFPSSQSTWGFVCAILIQERAIDSHLAWPPAQDYTQSGHATALHKHSIFSLLLDVIK